MVSKTTNQVAELRRTGVAVPVSALQTKESLGCGEFLDLIPFADFCSASGLSIIQILPVNDTGTESSPYSALSAFALHPLYVRISELKEFQALPSALLKELQDEIKDKQKQFSKQKRFNYRELRYYKLGLLKKIWDQCSADFSKSKETEKWIESNSWVKSYACFMVLKEKNHEASFKSWTEYKHLNKAEINELWTVVLPKDSLYFHVWVQKNASEQLQKASAYCKSKNVLLKGDIPILMNEDSVDIWANPEFFMDYLRAGSPPDGPNPHGQNWGFPIYNWKKLKEHDYSWWKERLLEASKYYQMYRIDHVLGFFRIWAVPEGESKAVLGWTIPYASISLDELLKCSLTKETVRWLSKPHVATREIEEVNNGDYLGTHGLLNKCMDRIGSEELWLFKDNITCDGDIWALDLPHPVKEKLAQKWLDRCLVEVEHEEYVPFWFYRDTTSWRSLNDAQRHQLSALFTQKADTQNLLWEKHARELLGALSSVGGMFACAEDLGVTLDSMPRVLESLSICALRVIRWHRLWQQPGQPFVEFSDYPELSVATSSVHDSSTLREWWNNEPDSQDFGRRFCENPALRAHDGSYVHTQLTPEICQTVLTIMARAKSKYFINPIQDFLYMDGKYYDADSTNERINVPGSVNEFNWTYKLPVDIANLQKNTELIQKIKDIVQTHNNV